MSLSGPRVPAGYIRVESKVPGVTVYAPAPPVETGPEVVTFKCPQCGATTAYDPAAAAVTCAHCGYRQASRADRVGLEAPQGEFTLDTLAQTERGWGGDRKELHCEACGADLSLAPADLSSTCPFCASNRVIARPATNNALRPGSIIPFGLSLGDATAHARLWLGRGWMHPGGLTAAARTARFRGVYLPYWTFSARLDAGWEAEVGHPETRRHYNAGTKSWSTTTVIRWEWKRGQVAVPLSDVLVPGTVRVSPNLLGRILPFELSALCTYQPDLLAGWEAQTYDVPLPTAWDQARAAMREETRQACYRDIHSPHVRNFTMVADMADETWRHILVPVFVAAYRFEERAYQVLVNGQTGTVSGQKPVAWWKIWVVVTALLLPGAILALLSLARVTLAAPGALLVLAALLFVVGAILAVAVIQRAMREGEA